MPARKKTEFAILGLLMWNPMSGYDIKKLVDVGLSHFWNENYGQIYPTLEKLVKNGLATKKTARKSGKRQRFVYTITPKGKEIFRDWVGRPTEPPVVRNELQLKLFLSANSPAKSSRLINQYRAQQRSQLEEYRASESLLRAAIKGKNDSEELNEILAISAPTPSRRQRQLGTFLMTLRHGILVIEARLAWCEEVIAHLTE